MTRPDTSSQRILERLDHLDEMIEWIAKNMMRKVEDDL